MDEVIDELRQNRQFKQGLQPLQAGDKRGETQVTSSESPPASQKDVEAPQMPIEERTSPADESAPGKGLQASADVASSRQEQAGVSIVPEAARESDGQETSDAPTIAAVPEAPVSQPQVNVSILLDIETSPKQLPETSNADCTL